MSVRVVTALLAVAISATRPETMAQPWHDLRKKMFFESRFAPCAVWESAFPNHVFVITCPLAPEDQTNDAVHSKCQLNRNYCWNIWYGQILNSRLVFLDSVEMPVLSRYDAANDAVTAHSLMRFNASSSSQSGSGSDVSEYPSCTMAMSANWPCMVWDA